MTEARMRRWPVVVALVAGIAALGVLWLLRALLLNADGVDVPAQARMPTAPAGVSVSTVEKQCGSGGCWLEMTAWPAAGSSPAEQATEMGVDQQRCAPLNVLDLRAVCTWSDVLDERLVVYLRYESPLPT